MEPRRRVLRSAAVVNAVTLVGIFLACGAASVFTLGTKSAPVFQTIPTPKTPSAPEPPKPTNGPPSTEPGQ